MTKPLTSDFLEPERRIELLTYALRVRCGCKLVESGGDTSATARGFAHFLGTRWSYTEASGLATEVTTPSDIHRSAEGTRLLSLLMATYPQNGLAIYTAPVPSFFSCLHTRSFLQYRHSREPSPHQTFKLFMGNKGVVANLAVSNCVGTRMPAWCCHIEPGNSPLT